jgi:uncharacterized membrane protein YccC
MSESSWSVLRTLGGRANLAQATRILAACALSYGASKLVGLPEGYWSLITVVVVTQPMLKETLAASRFRIVGTLIGAAAGLAVIAGVQAGLPLQPLFWGALLPLALLTAARPSLRVSCITLVILSLIPAPGPPLARAMDRVLEILLGVVASIAVLAALPNKSR